jgi:ubiquinone/menaquinone biosynthesis C-methylase UbiE
MTVQKDPEGKESKNLHAITGFDSQRVLEIGCGDGRLTWKFARAALKVVGIDLEAADLRIASIETPADLRASVFFARANSIYLPLRSDSFDLALLAWSF